MKTLVAAALLTGLGISLTGCVVSPPVAVAAAPVAIVPATVGITVGWHGDRYYDGHRYWARDEWMRSHPNDRGWHGQGDNHRGSDRQDDRRHDDDHHDH